MILNEQQLRGALHKTKSSRAQTIWQGLPIGN